MTEDELLQGITDALTAGGWLWTHVRRSDRAIAQGSPGVPDVIAVHRERRAAIVIECKGPGGRIRPGQWEWLDGFHAAGIDARIVHPDMYDALVVELVGDRLAELRRTGRV